MYYFLKRKLLTNVGSSILVTADAKHIHSLICTYQCVETMSLKTHRLPGRPKCPLVMTVFCMWCICLILQHFKVDTTYRSEVH